MEREILLQWVRGAGLAIAIWLFGWLFTRLALPWILRFTHRTRTDLDELLLDSLRPHVPVWFLLLGVMVALRTGDPGAQATAVVHRILLAAFLFSLTLASSSLVSRFIESRVKRWPGALPSTTLSQNAVRAGIIVVGLLVVLGTLGIAITPVLTALGVGSLAVALALQPTLSNVFAGFHITLARRVRVGDFVELETGQKGYVEDIGWRSTQIRELPDNLIIVPNSKFAEVIVTNYTLPATQQAVLVQVGVAYGSDLEQVERVTIETAREVQRTVQGAETGFEPFIRLHTFGSSSIDFTVILRVREFVDRYLVKHEFIKRLQRRYAEEGIEIPFPQRVVHHTAAPAGER